MKKSPWALYIIEAKNGSFYTGITTDVERRFLEHKSSKKRAKFFRTSPPKKIVLIEYFPNRSMASKRESEIKKMSKPDKLSLISTK